MATMEDSIAQFVGKLVRVIFINIVDIENSDVSKYCGEDCWGAFYWMLEHPDTYKKRDENNQSQLGKPQQNTKSTNVRIQSSKRIANEASIDFGYQFASENVTSNCGLR
ncbi:hypothetical protein ACTXT7_011469 [Hymenolepis weldensis]